MNIEKIVLDLKDQMKKDKEFFWNNPEKGKCEFKTASYIKSRLEEMGYEDINTNIYETGIVATLRGEKQEEKENSLCILFRSDMDAVVMDETGRTKHTCGHDAHMTILLSLAKILIDNKDKIKGTVKLLFQPDEEGDAGAKFMVQNGALDNPKVDKAFAIHVWSELKEDEIGIKEGTVMASSDPYDIIVYGKGGHAAMPEKCIDTIYIANKIGIALKNQTKKKIVEIVEKIAKEMGGKAEVKFLVEYPVVVNSSKEAKVVQNLAKNVVSNVITNYQTTTSEDFSYYLEKVPGCMIFVGSILFRKSTWLYDICWLN